MTDEGDTSARGREPVGVVAHGQLVEMSASNQAVSPTIAIQRIENVVW